MKDFKSAKSRRRAHDCRSQRAATRISLILMSHFADMENWSKSLGKGAPRPGGPLAVKAALAPFFFHVPPGMRC